MAGHEDSRSNSTGDKSAKKRRMRACDMCRRRKVRCDGGEMPGNKCSNCIAFEYECTYLAGTDKRFSDVAYVQNLENEVAELKRQLSKAQSEAGSSSPQHDSMDATSSSPQRQPSIDPSTPFLSPACHLPDDGEEDEDEGLVEHFKAMDVKMDHKHFLGRSSNLMLIQTAMDLKQEYVASDSPEASKGPRPKATKPALSKRRPEFWEPMPWLIQPKRTNTEFPEPGLMTELVQLYFDQLNVYFPLLHRPTFERGIRNGLHIADQGFGSVLLCVLALGARFSSDTRVLLPGTSSWHSAGWQYFKQVQESHRVINLNPPTLYDLQVASLSAAYVNGSSIPHTSFAAIGHGLRLAQDMGAHRRATYPSPPTVESELRKRAFWALVAIDRGMCSVLGRPCSIQEEDFDVDLPEPCDDDYWVIDENGNLSFHQPPDKPSTAHFYSTILRLGRVHAYALRSIYSVKMSRLRSDPQWAQKVVSELDSELNKWVDSVPEHLRWDPHREDVLFMCQSALLYSSYYSLQITVHRPFIPSPRKPSMLSFPSLAICTNAARSCIHVLDIQYNKVATPFHHWYQLPLFSCAIVLLLNVWGSGKRGSSTDPVKEMEEVYKAMRMLKVLEPRWSTAGRFWDVLYDLASVGDLPLPKQMQQSQKRRREEDSADSQNGPSPLASGSPASDPGQARPIAGSKRVQHYQQHSQPSPFSPPSQSDLDLVLPVHSDELGRLPPNADSIGYEQGNWDSLNAANYAVDPFSFNPAVFDGSFRPRPPAVDAIFGGLIPTSSYDEALAAFVQRNAEQAAGPLPVCVSPVVQPHQHQCVPQADTMAPGSWNGAPGTDEWDELERYLTSMSMPPEGGYAPG